MIALEGDINEGIKCPLALLHSSNSNLVEIKSALTAH